MNDLLAATSTLTFWAAVRILALALTFALWPRFREIRCRNLVRIGSVMLLLAALLWVFATVPIDL